MAAIELLSDVEINAEQLDWIALRKELDVQAESDVYKSPPYKSNILVKLGVTATAASLIYEIYHMNNTRKMLNGAYSRISFQFVTTLVVGAGYFYHERIKGESTS